MVNTSFLRNRNLGCMAKQPGNVACSNVDRGIWLVKVPKYLSEQWESQKGSSEIGRLKVLKSGPKQEIVFESTKDAGGSSSSSAHGEKPYARVENEKAVPKEHKFTVKPVVGQSLTLLRHDQADEEHDNQVVPYTCRRNGALYELQRQPHGATMASQSFIERLAIDGRIIQKAECRPVASTNYMKMKIDHIELKSKPTRFIQHMDRAEVKFKPVSQHVDHAAAARDKKLAKNTRMDSDELRDAIFKAFERHQYYKVQDLAAITKQPQNSVREILTEIGVFSQAPPHKFMWELKPEYRHYNA